MRRILCFLGLTGLTLMRPYPIEPSSIAASALVPNSKSDALSAVEIVKRSVRVNEHDWKAAPDWAFTERDVISRHGRKSVRTYEVLMLEGSPYNMLVAINDQPLSPAERDLEERKLKLEISKRRSETASARAKRIATYERERNQNHALMLEIVKAFFFNLVGTETVRGRTAYVLDATPNPDYVPNSRDSKVLIGMKGRLYVDTATFHWARVEAQVVKPVFFYGFLAKVNPGTRFALEEAPISNQLWLPIRFARTVDAEALGLLPRRSVEEETYSNYRPMAEIVEQVAL